jgi:hypothetical protein
MRRKQQGLSLIATIIIGVLVVLVLLVGAKVLPEVTEYYAIKQGVVSILKDPAAKGGTVADLRRAFSKHVEIQNIKSITPADLEISKEGGDVVIAFAYSSKVPLLANVSLLIDFKGSYSSKD